MTTTIMAAVGNGGGGGSGGGYYVSESGGALEAATALLLSPQDQPQHLLYSHLSSVGEEVGQSRTRTGGKVEGSGVERQGVVRLAPPNHAGMKLEPSDHSVLNEGSVIKTAPKTSHDPSSPKHEHPGSNGAHLDLMQHTVTLQDLQTMRPPYGDPYASPYARSVYDPGPNSYGTALAGLSSQSHLLPPNSQNMPPPYGLALQPQDVYYARSGDLNYAASGRGFPYAEGTEELIARSSLPHSLHPSHGSPGPPHSSSGTLAALSPVSAAIAGATSGALLWDPHAIHYSTPSRTPNIPPAPITSSSGLYKPVQVDMQQVSPVDSGIGQELIVTPNKENPLDGFQHYADVGMGRQPRTSASVERTISTNRDSPIRIPKLENPLGFQYTLEAPISTSVRKEDDRMTYINKGQFYCVSLDYYHDPEKLLRSGTVRSLLMVVFREEKAEDEEMKSWQFWHSRQHSVKQRILDVDTNNSSGIVGKLEEGLEVSHNAVQFCWNPMEQSVKINVAVHCLSTDFSNQKGVKGFPLHLQIDTYDDLIDSKVPFHRGYCQVKVFCDKGANRKMLHEARRDEKRRLQGRKKSDAEYHEPCDRSEFYHMSNLHKPAVLFTPPEDYDRQFPPMESFYGVEPGLMEMKTEVNGDGSESGCTPPVKRQKLYPQDRVLIYVRKPEESVFSPLHLHPPNLDGLLNALGDKYPEIPRDKISALFKQCRKGVTVKLDDAMVKYYSNEDTYILQVTEDPNAAGLALTLQELDLAALHSQHSQHQL